MALYAIGDLHLSLSSDKPMTVFGGRWENYVEKILSGFSALSDDDVCVICGDLSWAMSLEEAREDLLFLGRLPGKKIILKGNHDYWWNTATKMSAFFESLGLDDFQILHNNCIFYRDIAICGTRGWFFEEEKGGADDRKVMLREVGRLETSLKAAGDREKFVFLHYPPKFADYECYDILELLREYQVNLCCYGHIHSKGCSFAFEKKIGDTQFRLVSADHLFFKPLKILE